MIRNEVISDPHHGSRSKENIMTEYLVLVYADISAFENQDPDSMGAMMAAHAEFGRNNFSALRGGNALEAPRTAASIRNDAAGNVTVTKAPFTPVEEMIGGYYVIEADDLDGAIAIAQQVPAPSGGVEVRPIRVID
jgi:hypothetical protein